MEGLLLSNRPPMQPFCVNTVSPLRLSGYFSYLASPAHQSRLPLQPAADTCSSSPVDAWWHSAATLGDWIQSSRSDHPRSMLSSLQKDIPAIRTASPRQQLACLPASLPTPCNDLLHGTTPKSAVLCCAEAINIHVTHAADAVVRVVRVSMSMSLHDEHTHDDCT